MFQNWKSVDIISPTTPESDSFDNMTTSASQPDERKDSSGTNGERRHSKEDG